VVLDPTKDSETADILFETSLRGLDLQFKGGLSMASNPTIFTDEKAGPGKGPFPRDDAG